MLGKTLLGLVFTVGFALAGEKAQAPAAAKAQAPAAAKAQAPAAKIVTQTVHTKEYVPVEKRRKLFFRQFGPTKVETCINCTTCPNCKK